VSGGKPSPHDELKDRGTVDIFTPQKRSQIMSRVRGEGTAPERYVLGALRRAGFRASARPAGLPCKPDVVLSKYRTAIFVHGCFWHGHGCRRAKLPSTNTEFWREKISGNIRRDARATRALRRLGWHCLHIWSCRLKAHTERVVRRLERSRAL
jgi:DNA mismatch endonuclease (patch repair protein)